MCILFQNTTFQQKIYYQMELKLETVEVNEFCTCGFTMQFYSCRVVEAISLSRYFLKYLIIVPLELSLAYIYLLISFFTAVPFHFYNILILIGMSSLALDY